MVGQFEVEGVRHYPSETIRDQIAAVLSAWGMRPAYVQTTARVMADADACGIDTHGISMIPPYDQRRREGILTVDGEVTVQRETPVSALVDGGGGLGYVPSVRAAEIAIDKARTSGLAAVAVRNSNHFGAAGYYTRMMADAGLIGLSTTNASGPRSAPTFGREARLSTNPLAFAAPTKRHPAFSLDMATTTVAAGKVRNRANEGAEIPVGWAAGPDGLPLTDPREYERLSRAGATLSPLGGTPEGASYKGYGLGAMVEILSVALSGASLVTSENHGYRTPGTMDLGHFFLAIDPTMFRDPGECEATVDELIDHLHDTTPVDPAQPVMVAGEPENLIRSERERTGVPMPPGLRERIRRVADEAGADFLLD